MPLDGVELGSNRTHRDVSTMSSSNNRSSIWKAITLAALACATIVTTALAAGAKDAPKDAVDEARKQAERAAATEAALETVEVTEPPKTVSSDVPALKASESAVSKAVRGVEAPKLSMLPDDWEKAGLDLDKAERRDGRLVQELPSGLTVEFTVDPDVQAHMESILEDYNVPHGGVVLIEPETGRVLAMVDQTTDRPEMPSLARHASAPSASVFKIVTAAALLEDAGVSPARETCYRGGASHLTKANITNNPGSDGNCRNLGEALGWSINAIIAKLSHRYLDQSDLQQWANRFGYNSKIPFELPVEQSTADIVDDPIERARTAAGFWHTYLSPLHGAMIGAAVENRGLMMRPSMIEKVTGPDGEVLKEFEPTVFRRVMKERTARTLARLLEQTAIDGTADNYFRHRYNFPNDVTAAGKTGTLANHDPYLSFTWFVGFGRHETIEGHDAAVGGLICNTPKWRIKGAWAASEALRYYYAIHEKRAQRELANAK
jgi:membrane peptidoglycan carboxypeptidase